MNKNVFLCFIVGASFIASLTISANLASAQAPVIPVNTVCKTGTDADLPEIKTKISKMVTQIKQLKQSNQDARVSTDALYAEVLAIDEVLMPLRARHKFAAYQAVENETTYSKYKINWIETGELVRLNQQIHLRKQKHGEYKSMRQQYVSTNTEYETLGIKYQHIARDLLDRDRDCAAAYAALM